MAFSIIQVGTPSLPLADFAFGMNPANKDAARAKRSKLIMI